MKQTDDKCDDLAVVLDKQSGQRAKDRSRKCRDYRDAILGTFIGSLIGTLTINVLIALFESGGFNSLLLGLAAMFFGGLIVHLFYNS